MKPKKLILSRKGFDSANGGCASPIFENDTMFSLPIPDDRSEVAYRDLRHGGMSIGEVVTDLTRNRIGPEHRAHLDPDINREAYPRLEGWRPLFGQDLSAQGHLRNQGVGTGDVFLFFGLYQQVVKTSGHWRFDGDAPPQHVLWGWLQVEDVHSVDSNTKGKLPWAAHFPHLSEKYESLNNTLYVSSDGLDLGDGPIAAGAGVFPRFDEHLALTEPGKSVSSWRLPRWFYPDPSKGKKMLSWHGDNLNRWGKDENYAYLQSVARGQEFVLDLANYPEATGWLTGLVRDLGE